MSAGQHDGAVAHNLRSGVFVDGPFIGLRYSTGSGSGVIGVDGVFTFTVGETVTFSLGGVIIGETIGAAAISTVDLVPTDAKDPLSSHGVTNRARFLQSFGDDSDLRDGVTITDSQVEEVSRRAEGVDFDSDRFDTSQAVHDLFGQLGLRLRSVAEARNHLRRALRGIRLLRDVEIPTRDGSFLSADVFLPAGPGRVPAILRLGLYGKAFGSGSAIEASAVQASETREDTFFQMKVGDQRATSPFENTASANAHDWVPRGYAIVRIDGRGIGKTPGVVSPLSRQEAEDYYDAIQWVAGQSWCDGQVGLVGASYQATNQWAVAAMHPPALVAMIPFAGDQDGYRELAYPGGIYNEHYREWWFNERVLPARPSADGPYVDFLKTLKEHPFDGEFYTNDIDAPLGVRCDKIDVPVMTAISQTMMLHGRGGIEAFNALRGPKHLLIVDAAYQSYMTHDTLKDQIAFMDKYAKAKEVSLPAVRMIVRKGANEIEWRSADAWPPAGTAYQELFLDGSDGSAGWGAPQVDALIQYSAEVNGAEPRPGAYFYTEPLDEDLDLIGHFTANLFVSSSTSDADVYVALRVFDGEEEVHYGTREESPRAPLTWGFLKASHRKTDPSRSTAERPWHTHTEEDYLPLVSAEIVELAVELLPATARVRAGWRFRIEITASEGPGVFQDIARVYDPEYHAGAVNAVHTGPATPSRLVVPRIERE
ncbi:CocE/NonD family hydrolase [Pseudonocardia oroxyli]|nr:CocE/NonD family hydrolase [Pseudonocardia oroxyli]